MTKNERYSKKIEKENQEIGFEIAKIQKNKVERTIKVIKTTDLKLITWLPGYKITIEKI